MATSKKDKTAAPDMAFNVARRRVRPVTFTLEGDEHVYEFTAPKMAAYSIDVMLGVEESSTQNNVKRMFDWLGDGLREGEVDRIIARIKDKDDDLDLTILEDVLKWLQGKTAGRPTT